jgi:hypothetical protein
MALFDSKDIYQAYLGVSLEIIRFSLSSSDSFMGDLNQM